MPDERRNRNTDEGDQIPDQFTLAGGRMFGSGPEIPPLVFTRVKGEKGRVYQATLTDFDALRNGKTCVRLSR